MIANNDRMRCWVLSCLFLGVLGACEQRNPERCSDSNHCPDPSLPFCDVDGSIGGQPRECIAVSCAAQEFEACRGEQEIRCNTSGDSFDVVQCELGCDSGIGCRLCEPNQTRCTNGKVATCDGGGSVVSMESCSLGCFLDEPRCRDIDPSNGLAEIFDLGGNEVIDLTGGYIYTESGEVRDSLGMLVPMTSALKTTATATAIRVFVARRVRLNNVSVFMNQDDRTRNGFFSSGPAIAFLATESVEVDGRLIVHAGAVADCSGGAGQVEIVDNQFRFAGSGGGGHATAGAVGGSLSPLLVGGSSGAIVGTESIPLRGGCKGGYSGGGAVQLSSRGSVNIKGVIDVRGKTPDEGNGGGGAGGGILIEGAQVKLEANARLIALGGGGGAGIFDRSTLPTPKDDGTPEPGVPCAVVTNCGAGGNGAAPGIPATDGVTVGYNTSVQLVSGGGGGGGLGRIRINTPDRTYTRSSSAIEAGVVSTGVLSTR